MNKINLSVRLKNPLFIIQLIGAIVVPILTYAGLTLEDMTSWKVLGDTILEAISHPYIVGLIAVSVSNAIIDPTTKGIGDSNTVLEYKKPS